MESVNLEVLRRAVGWMDAGVSVTLATVVKTWGSSPRPEGALLAISGDGQLVGSVSGGCIEDDLMDRLRQAHPRLSKFDSYLAVVISCFWIRAGTKMFSIGVEQPDSLRRARPCPNYQS